MIYRYRCSSEKCRMRVTLKKRVEEYVRKEPVCKCCGSKLTIDSYRQSRNETKKYNCHCDGMHFVHRIGSKWCNYYKGEYTEEELRERRYI